MYKSDPKPAQPAPRAVHHELRTAENSAAYFLPALQLMKEENPNLSLLDVGAGSGTISVSFAKAIPDGQVTATDVNKGILVRAEEIAGLEGVKNIMFQEADAYKLPFADGTFDITHCHQVLCHLKEPWDVLREMLRVTKPGGVVAVREGDYETECVWPASAALSKFHQFVVYIMNMAGGSSTAGRQLLAWALKAGVRRDHITASYGTWCYNTSIDKKAWAQAMIEQIQGGRLREIGIQSGQVTEQDFVEAAKAWEEWERRDDGCLGMMHGEIIIQK